MIMSLTSQLSDNVPVCRRGITSKQFGYLGELVSSAKSYRISRKFRRSALTLIAVLQTEMFIVEVARSSLLTITTKSRLGQIFGQRS